MMRPIIVYFNGTFVNRENGAHARVYDLLTFLANLGGRVRLYSFTNHPSCPWGPDEIERFHVEFPNVELTLDHRGRLLRAATNIKARLISLFPASAGWFITMRVPFLARNYTRLLARAQNALIVVNYACGLLELNGIDASAAIIETHDLHFLNSAKAHKQKLTSIKTILKARCEFELLLRSASLIAIAPPDASVFRLFFTGKPIFFVPSYKRIVSRQDNGVGRFRYDLVFVGSENLLNVSGLIAFFREYSDWLSGRRFAVVGRICTVDVVREAAAEIEGVELVGYVEDLVSLLQTSKIAVSPVDGTGLKIKALESLAAGRPLFGSRHTLDSLPPGHDDCAFPFDRSRMQQLLTDDAALQRAEQAAVKYCETLGERTDLNQFSAHMRCLLSVDRQYPNQRGSRPDVRLS